MSPDGPSGVALITGYRIALHGKGDDFVVATGVTRSIADFVAADLLRPADRAAMVSDAAKAAAILGRRPTKSSKTS
jgi:GDPmannose 4,6-dehydratase